MSDSTDIEWADATWNPVKGCTRVSEGCRNCYAERAAARFSKPGEWGHGYAEWRNGEPRWTGKVSLIEEKLDLPLHWQRSRRIFVNSTSDLFHEQLATEEIGRVFATMTLFRRHTFLILTKRPERMLDFISRWPPRVIARAPLKNVWLGASVEDRASAGDRRDWLMRVAKLGWTTFVSYEPALGQVDWRGWRFLDWIIVGGESGPKARRSRVDNIRDALRHGRKTGIPVFVKQMGARVIDRAAAGFGGCAPTEWPAGTRTEEDPHGYLYGGRGDDVRVLLRDRKGGDPAEWPEDLRVRELPR
ncbi:MAG: DUF5131 family protein [Rhodospirillales bacterium]|nr:DUF5131 family protein [Rhodospirillales bacterium]